MDIQSLLEAVRQSPEMMESVAQISQELESEGVSPEMLEAMGQAVGQVIDSPDTYPEVRAQAVEQGWMDEEDLPPEFNLAYMLAILVAINEVMGHLSQAPRFAKGGLAQLARQGRGGDTMLAHINGAEAEVLRRMGGSGTVNPNTGIIEFKGGGLKTALSAMTKGVRKVVKKLAKPILTIASVIPGPWQVPALALNAAYSASQGNWLGAALSAFGAYAAPGGFGGFTGTGGTAAGMGGSLGNGITGSLGTVGGEAAGMAGSLGGGISGGLGTAGSAAGGISGSLGGLGGSLAGAGSELAAGMAGGTGTTAMEGIGGLGDGISGSIAEYGASSPGLLPQLDTETMDMIKTGKNIYGAGKTAVNAYQMLNPPEPEEYSQQNTQRQMQQMGGLRMNTNSSFGLGGTNQRHAGQFSNLGMGARGFRNGGLARCTCKGN